MFWRFSIIASSHPSHSLATDYWPLFSCHGPLSSCFTPHAPRSTPPSAGTSGVRSCANPPPLASLSPTVGLPKTERDPISTSGASIFSMSPNQAIPTEKLIRFFPTRRRPTVDHSLVAGDAQRQWLQACLPMAKALPVFRGVGWPRVNLTPGVTYSCGRRPASPAPWAKCLLRNELRRRPDCNPPKPRMSRGQKPQCLSSLCVSRAVRFAARSGAVPSSQPRWTALKTHTCLVSASFGQRPMRESKGTERTGWLSPLLMKLTRELYDGTPNAGYSTLSTGVGLLSHCSSIDYSEDGSCPTG